MTVMDMVSCRLIIHTRDAQATTVSIFILHTLTLFAECRTSPGTAARKPLPKVRLAVLSFAVSLTIHFMKQCGIC